MTQLKATKLGHLRKLFRPVPIPVRLLEDYYVDTAKVRGGAQVVRQLENILRSKESELKWSGSAGESDEWRESEQIFHEQIIFSGYRGCGKSTELNRLIESIEADFLVMKFSVTQKLDPISLHFSELFIATMEELFGVVEEYDLYEEVSPEFLKAILDWTKTEEVESVRVKHFEVGGEAGAELRGGLAWVGKFFGKFRLAAKSSKSMKKTLSENIEPKISELILLCNNLLWQIEKSLGKFGKKGMLIVIEDLDKVPLDVATLLFRNYAHQLTALNTNVIFTFPLALVYNPHFTSIRGHFSKDIVLPMIKINHQNGQQDADGRKKMADIVGCRMDLDLFEREDFLHEMIGYSGGCLRDLFLMIQEAGDHAESWDRERITKEDYIHAVNGLKQDYRNLLSDKIETGAGGNVVKI